MKFRIKLTQIKIQFPTFVPMNFRKHISVVLASLVLLANLGLSFAVHYCKDEIASVSFQYQEDEPYVEEVKSCCAKEDSHDSCCSNKLIKVEKKKNAFLIFHI
ncbi:MAG: HYC_CC_PP family protein [Flavobacterium sp.]